MDRNEYTIAQHEDGTWLVLCNGRAILAGLTKQNAFSDALRLELSQQPDEDEEREA